MTHIGIDIIEIDRVEKAIARWGDGFLRRVYTDAELELCASRVQSLAGRFAAKEAAIKAISGDGSGLFLKDIEILTETSGKPLVRLHGKAREVASQSGLSGLSVSLSHSRKNAVAVAIGEARIG
jgi:holo-[acyl-carrier protein] synthase